MEWICKRVTALLLALVMLMSFGTAFAAEIPTDQAALTQTDGNAQPPEEMIPEEMELTPEDVGEEIAEVGETEEKEEPLLDASVSYFSNDELFVYVGKSVAPTMETEAPEGAEFTSSDTEVVTVNQTTGKLKGVGVGKATITLKSDGTKLDTLTVYGYQYTTFTKETNYTDSAQTTKDTSSPLTVTTTTGDVVHTYKTFNQQAQYDEGGNKITNLSSHGCAISSTAEVAQGFGLEDVTPVWLQQEGVPTLADSLDITLGNALGTGSGARPLGFYGMKKTLGQMGISSKVYTWTKDTRDDAVLEMTTALSEGRPVIVVVYKDSWNGIQLTTGYHFLLLTGIDKNGYVIFLNTSGGKVRYAMGATRKLTVSELVYHFIRSDIKHTNSKDFFYYQPTGSGCMACVEVTSNTLGKRKLTASGKASITKASVTLSKSTYTYSGKARKPKVAVKIGKKTLEAGVDYTYWYNNNTNVGTDAVVTIRGAGSYTGLMQKKFTINKANNTITAQNKTVAVAAKKKTVQLSASALGNASVTFSTTDKTVTVSKAGLVTIPANYAGSITVTVTAAATSNYAKTTKNITLTVRPKAVTLSSVKSNAAKKLTAKWTKNSVASGYQVQYSTKKDFSSEKVTVTVKNSSKVSKTISKLTKGKKYYVRVRCYKTYNKKNYTSKWSSVKSVTVKKK